MIAIINYGIGNLGSIRNMIEHVGGNAVITDSAETLLEATALILPGVGAFDACVGALRGSGLLSVVERRVHTDRIPLLGICVGLQLLADRSEEGREPGLGWIKGDVERLRPDPEAKLKVPHLGWRSIDAGSAGIWTEVGHKPRFYFAHSYHFVPSDKEVIVGTLDYGGSVVAAVSQENILAVQFHPEKSHKFGFQFFRQYLKELGAWSNEGWGKG
ncbi:imidazole glycerol phosphate synthase subunit HisH [Bradyrhizobium sp. OAE829]|uniref:imidazole glycerol phosphate synthase subunit HisH n=1 Tax=Bradyrhizobium sp. OAE829 TaxID=2663807 RepID=UPI00178B8E1C